MILPAGALFSISLLVSRGSNTSAKATNSIMSCSSSSSTALSASTSADELLLLPKIVRSLNNKGEHQQTQPSKSSSVNPAFLPKHLVVHFDINETVLVGDDAGGDTREDSLNKILAKSAFVRIPTTGDDETPQLLGKSMDDDDQVVPTHWWDGSLIGDGEMKSPPPLYTGWNWPPGCCPYYRTAFKKRAKQFVHTADGKPYEALYHEMERLIAFPQDSDDAAADALPPILFHLLPALFHTLQTTRSNDTQPRVTFCFRTFGSDLPEIADAVTAFARGQHPNYPGQVQPELELPRAKLVRGRWKTVTESSDGSKPTMLYQLLDYHDDTILVASGDDEIVQFLESNIMCGIQDDYEFWAANEWEPWAGKPVWVPSTSDQVQHVLLDDNIHNLPNDSIASVRRQQQSGGGDSSTAYETLSGPEIQEMQGLHLIRVPTIEPILNPNWFVEQLGLAQSNFAAAAQEIN
jgi:hypothetical protein